MMDIDNMTTEEMKKLICEAPEQCPITGLRKCTSYIFEEGVVYLSEPAYDAYTLPEYDPETKSFSRTKIDMDDDFRREDEWLCDLDDLREREDFEQIKAFYKIIE